MLKITAQAQPTGIRLLHLEGRLTGPWVEELRNECARALGDGARLTLDLSGICFADRQGVALLHELTRCSVTFKSPTPFIAARLAAEHP